MAIAAAVLAYGLSKQAVYERASDHATAEYQRYAYYPQLRACVRGPASDRSNCIAEAHQAERSNARDERDLEAQRITAAWTAIMGGAAVTGMLLSALGVGLVWTTFRETKGSNELFRIKERAQLVPHIEVAVKAMSKIEIYVSGKNIGPTAAINVVCDMTLQKDLPATPDTADPGKAIHYVKGNEAQMFQLVDIDGLEAINQYIFGSIRYDTLFSNGHRIPFCWRLERVDQHPSIGGRGPVAGIVRIPADWPKAT